MPKNPEVGVVDCAYGAADQPAGRADAGQERAQASPPPRHDATSRSGTASAASSFRDGDEVELASRGGKTMTRYFPEVRRAGPRASCRSGARRRRADRDPATADGSPARLRAARPAHPPGRVPGEAARRDHPGRLRRLRPAGPRRRVAARRSPTRQRRAAAGARRWPGPRRPVHVTPGHHRPRRPRGAGSTIFEGAGLDGLIAKPADLPYEPGKRLMFKVKHARTADAVVAGFRWHKSGPVVGSLLLGLYDDERAAAPRRRQRVVHRGPARGAARRAGARTGDVGDGHPWRAAATSERGSDRMPGARQPLDRQQEPRAGSRCAPSWWSRSATTRWRATGSGTPPSSCAGGPTAIPAPAVRPAGAPGPLRRGPGAARRPGADRAGAC